MAKTKDGFISEKLISPAGVACFTHLAERHSFKNDDKKERPGQYSTILVWNAKRQKAPEFKAICKAVVQVAKARFGNAAIDDPDDPLSLLARKYKNPLRDGMEYEEYEAPFTDKGAIFSAFRTTKRKPGIVDKDRDELDEDEVYAGAIMRVTFVARAFDTEGNKGVHFLLNNVQKVADGERLVQQADAADDFAENGDDDDDDGDLIGRKKKKR
jgi:hypothetical protein